MTQGDQDGRGHDLRALEATLEGLARELERVREILEGSSGPRRAGKPGDLALSRREHEIADLVADGNTNAEIAAQLAISKKTVESHLASAFRKLGVSKRGAVARALDRARDAAKRGATRSYLFGFGLLTWILADLPVDIEAITAT